MPGKKPKTQGNAHYVLHVPTHDPLGNELQDLSAIGAQWAQDRLRRRIHSIHTEGPHPSHPYRHLKILAIDHPETDSHIKNIGVDLAKMSAHPHIFGFKDGQQGAQPWNLLNPTFDGQSAHPDNLSVSPPQATVAPQSYMGHP